MTWPSHRVVEHVCSRTNWTKKTNTWARHQRRLYIIASEWRQLEISSRTISESRSFADYFACLFSRLLVFCSPQNILQVAFNLKHSYIRVYNHWYYGRIWRCKAAAANRRRIGFAWCKRLVHFVFVCLFAYSYNTCILIRFRGFCCCLFRYMLHVYI